jgi:hypothetical protein
MRNVSDTSCWENQNTRFKLNNFISVNCAVYEIHATDDKTLWRIRFLCGSQSYRHTLGIFNTYCFSAATMVTRTRIN